MLSTLAIVGVSALLIWIKPPDYSVASSELNEKTDAIRLLKGIWFDRVRDFDWTRSTDAQQAAFITSLNVDISTSKFAHGRKYYISAQISKIMRNPPARPVWIIWSDYVSALKGREFLDSDGGAGLDTSGTAISAAVQ